MSTFPFCTNCGTQALQGSTFCGGCGSALAQPEPIAVPSLPGAGVANDASDAGTMHATNDPSGHQHKKRGWIVVGVVVVLVTAGGIGLAISHTDTATPAATTNASPAQTGGNVAVSLPVVECPTTQGIQGTSPSTFPSSIAVTLPRATAKTLAYYSDSTRSISPIMAPAGWSCSALEAVDGGITLSVFPSSEAADFASRSTSPQPFTASKDVAVIAYFTGACQGCVFDASCPLIPYVGSQTGQDSPCPAAAPAGEVIKWLNGSPTDSGAGSVQDLVSFVDPPGVAGDGVPSGGTSPASGLLSYSTGSGEPNASLITCTLPSAQKEQCAAILSDFSTRNWPSTGAATPAATTAPPTTTVPPMKASTTPAIDPITLAGNIYCSGLASSSQLPEVVTNPQPSSATHCEAPQGHSTISSVDHNYVYVTVTALDSSGQTSSDPISAVVNIATSTILATGDLGACPSSFFVPPEGTQNVPSAVLASFGRPTC